MTPRRVLFGIAVLCVSLLTTTIETPAKDSLGLRSIPHPKTRRSNVRDTAQLRGASSQLDARIYGVTLSKRDIQKAMKAAITKCSCACPAPSLDSWGACFQGCLEGNGVSTVSAAACLAICSRNPIGCAICGGIHQWIVMGCAQYCVWRGVLTEEDAVSNPRSRPLRSGGTHQVRRLAKSSDTGAL